jgi:hypothetical protein
MREDDGTNPSWASRRKSRAAHLKETLGNPQMRHHRKKLLHLNLNLL